MAAKYEIEKFKGNNFSLWKIRMKAILRKDNCVAAIEERPADFTDDAKWTEMDSNAIANLHLALADEVLSSVAEKGTAKEVWYTLVNLYEAKSLHNKIFLKRKLYTLRMMETSSIVDGFVMDDESIQSKSWLEKPAGYREMVIAYSTEMKMLGLKILDLMGEALGMEAGYFERNNLTENLNIMVNHYPVCPNPSSTMGTAPHYDPNLITILHHQLFGLQIFNNGEWLGVDPLPRALTVIVSSQLQIISNDELKGCKHRAVTNSRMFVLFWVLIISITIANGC
ncbi:PREDICTED: protein DOWNY MILDEW RESISTANCE 6-like [Ipomoea nil]|uniref:protein DOWNY MILDEW RESISTANCE 6-like n=1 Tax=Ipomoea nil TaxID=35883 RepID=UPI00090183CC|nr:PREDICTED: protein DOWNY MILDEW RESISTANCE 6-like [Ipomoea nil]